MLLLLHAVSMDVYRHVTATACCEYGCVYRHVTATACCQYGCLSTVMLLLLHAVSMDVCLPSCYCYCMLSVWMCLPSCYCYCMLSVWMSVYRHVTATACCEYGCLSTVMLLLLHAVSMDVCLPSCYCYCML